MYLFIHKKYENILIEMKYIKNKHMQYMEFIVNILFMSLLTFLVRNFLIIYIILIL